MATPDLWFRLLPVLTVAVLSSGQVFAQSRDNAELSTQFAAYEQALDRYIHLIIEDRWDEAESEARNISRLSDDLLETGRRKANNTWIYYANNLVNHCEELVEANEQRDGVKAIYLIAILLNHLEQIQSSVPAWLRDHINQQLEVLSEAVRTHNNAMARDAAEIIHSSASSILLSIVSSPNTYTHTAWAGNIILINGLGDQVLGAVNRDEWDQVPERIDHIRHLIEKWQEGFRSSPATSQ